MSKQDLAVQQGLLQIREKIDKIDQQIIDLLSQRSDCIEEVAEYKCLNKLSIYDGARENKIIEKIIQTNPTKFQAVDMASIFHAILRAGLNQQLLYRAEHQD